MLRTLFFYLSFYPWTLFVILTGVPLSFIRADYLHNYACLWGRIGLLLAGVRLTVHGKEHLNNSGSVIYMGNHQSNFDILALFAGLPGQFRWIAKEELFRIPLFGYSMKRCGYIPLNRKDRRKALLSMRSAAERIAAGTSVIIFPEGTRSEDGNLLPFKKGGFSLAQQAGVPIVPLAINGSRGINPKGSLRVFGGHIEITIFPPLASEGPVEDLMERVRTTIVESLQATPSEAA
ncbi:MAG: 1-acyl-sn-glycerol-3-phosphate acyltransferase [Desulfuromonas sp.]|nr:MAG: 1-acyl-sn-glycerol-3-phosphate acyltransferase [Desulfuromonas sp.]